LKLHGRVICNLKLHFSQITIQILVSLHILASGHQPPAFGLLV